MPIVLIATLWLAGIYPIATAWRANRTTSLGHALAWAAAAWLAWGWALLGVDAETHRLDAGRFVALAVAGSASVAVLGARRPHVGAWNFVVFGLLAVTLLPLLESLFIGTHPVDPLRIFFLSATLGVGLLNYLPTRSAPAVLMLAVAETGEMAALFNPDAVGPGFFDLLVLLAPWAAWGCWRNSRTGYAECDRLWLDFRDRFGLFWGQRVREQFNRAAASAGWPVNLSWRGLHRQRRQEAIAPADQADMVATLRAATQRFVETPA